MFCLIALYTGRATAQQVADGGSSAADAGNGSQASAAAATIRHTPLNEVLASEARLFFEVNAPDRAGSIVVHVVPLGRAQAPFQGSAVREDASGYALQLPASSVAPPGFNYWVTERFPDGRELPVFASAARPHRVRVSRSAEDEAERRRLTLRGGQRSMLLLSGEGVDYGDRKLSPSIPRQHDRYYRFEVGYAYAFLTRVDEIRLTLVRVRGQAGMYEGRPLANDARPGIDYGRAAVTLLGTELVRVRGALLFGASQRGFAYGGGGSLVLGDPRDTNLDLGVEAIKTLGATAHLRLGFLATPRIPMGAAIEVSNFPLGDDPGVRLLYDVGYYLGPVSELRLRGGYQGRTSISGGASLALDLCYGF